MPRKSVNQLIEQGYMIQDANLLYAGQPWELTPALVAAFTPAFNNLRSAQALCENIRIEKEANSQRANLERTRIEHTIARLKQFIRVVADKETAESMFHTLGIDDTLPSADEDLVTKLMSVVVPHLSDWDLTPQEIAVAVKTEVSDGTTEFADAVRDSIEKQAQSTTATQDRDNKRDIYEDVLTQIRNWLYLMLPGEKYDAHLDEYGFEIWDKPTYGGGTNPEEPEEPEEPGEPWPAKPQNFIGELHIEVPIITLKWDALAGAEKYNMKKYIGGLGEIAPPPPADYWKTGWIPNDIGETDIVPGMRHFYWVCGTDPAGVEGDWAMVWVDFPI